MRLPAQHFISVLSPSISVLELLLARLHGDAHRRVVSQSRNRLPSPLSVRRRRALFRKTHKHIKSTLSLSRRPGALVDEPLAQRRERRLEARQARPARVLRGPAHRSSRPPPIDAARLHLIRGIIEHARVDLPPRRARRRRPSVFSTKNIPRLLDSHPMHRPVPILSATLSLSLARTRPMKKITPDRRPDRRARPRVAPRPLARAAPRVDRYPRSNTVRAHIPYSTRRAPVCAESARFRAPNERAVKRGSNSRDAARRHARRRARSSASLGISLDASRARSIGARERDGSAREGRKWTRGRARGVIADSVRSRRCDEGGIERGDRTFASRVRVDRRVRWRAEGRATARGRG